MFIMYEYMTVVTIYCVINFQQEFSTKQNSYAVIVKVFKLILQPRSIDRLP